MVRLLEAAMAALVVLAAAVLVGAAVEALF
jgi:hypothetical protein